MPRKKHLRKVVAPPKFKSYVPVGSRSEKKEKIQLFYEEFEAVKLADYDGMHHHEACSLMGVSRATFARIYESARNKIAKALVEVREIEAVFGNAEFNEKWFLCNDCQARFTLKRVSASEECPICTSVHFDPIINKEL